MLKCPFCNNEISGDADFCPYCNESLKTLCPFCKEEINVNDKVCPYCSTKLRNDSYSIFSKITYLLLFLNALLPYWFGKSIINNPNFWHAEISKKNGFEDMVSCFVGILVISSIPSIIGVISNYRKKFFCICIVIFIIFCIFNLYLACGIK